jgi:glycerol-3-phosphate cytidylyltransferase-like family protein
MPARAARGQKAHMVRLSLATEMILKEIVALEHENEYMQSKGSIPLSTKQNRSSVLKNISRPITSRQKNDGSQMMTAEIRDRGGLPFSEK